MGEKKLKCPPISGNAIIDRTNEEDDLAEEQRVLDDNDDVIAELNNIRIQRLLSAATHPVTPEAVRVATKQLTLLQTNLDSVNNAVSALDDDLKCTLEEHKDQASELKSELAKLKTSLLSSEATPT